MTRTSKLPRSTKKECRAHRGTNLRYVEWRPMGGLWECARCGHYIYIESKGS